jgi:2-amino-4-hydroxy-6-hydroxymethyldihydropteridine diphosphokinase
MSKIYLILGSNIGNKQQTIEKAIVELEKRIGAIHQKSSMYATEPWGMNTNEIFINQVVALESEFLPLNILKHCLEIEKQFGRTRHSNTYENRTLDVDILFIDQMILNSKDLQIPHPRILERRFVLEPLLEICPDFVHPQLNKTIRQLYNDCADGLRVEKVV